MSDIQQRTAGRWRDILPAFGIDAKFLMNRHGPCPMCDGKDRFRFDDKGRGMWYCSHCGAGDGFKLIMLRSGLDFMGAVREVEPLVDGAKVQRFAPKPSNSSLIKNRQALWGASVALDGETIAGRYLHSRTGATPVTNELRASSSVRHISGEVVTYHPALLARIRDATGQAVNIHVTYLDREGGKAMVDPVRKIMPGEFPAGAAVRLFPAAETMAIAEGIETALSFARRFGVSTWAALNAGRLKTWEPPPIAKTILIAGDNDANYIGQEAAYSLAVRLGKSRDVRVEIPATVGHDWNDEEAE